VGGTRRLRRRDAPAARGRRAGATWEPGRAQPGNPRAQPGNPRAQPARGRNLGTRAGATWENLSAAERYGLAPGNSWRAWARRHRGSSGPANARQNVAADRAPAARPIRARQTAAATPRSASATPRFDLPPSTVRWAGRGDPVAILPRRRNRAGAVSIDLSCSRKARPPWPLPRERWQGTKGRTPGHRGAASGSEQ
jgi:hypothetical protein